MPCYPSSNCLAGQHSDRREHGLERGDTSTPAQRGRGRRPCAQHTSSVTHSAINLVTDRDRNLIARGNPAHLDLQRHRISGGRAWLNNDIHLIDAGKPR